MPLPVTLNSWWGRWLSSPGRTETAAIRWTILKYTGVPYRQGGETGRFLWNPGRKWNVVCLPSTSRVRGQSRWLPICWSVKGARKVCSQKPNPPPPAPSWSWDAKIYHPSSHHPFLYRVPSFCILFTNVRDFRRRRSFLINSVMDCIVSLQIHMLKSNSQNLRMWRCFKNGLSGR